MCIRDSVHTITRQTHQYTDRDRWPFLVNLPCSLKVPRCPLGVWLAQEGIRLQRNNQKTCLSQAGQKHILMSTIPSTMGWQYYWCAIFRTPVEPGPKPRHAAGWLLFYTILALVTWRVKFSSLTHKCVTNIVCCVPVNVSKIRFGYCEHLSTTFEHHNKTSNKRYVSLHRHIYSPTKPGDLFTNGKGTCTLMP